MRRIKRALAALAAVVLALGQASALAAEDTVKEEVVYVRLEADGRVEAIDVVNIFDLAQAGQIVDHGAYESVRNMTGTEPISYDGETAVIEAGAGRLYYEGRLKDTTIPWDISLGYYLDGQERTAEELAGMSGELEIRLHIGENAQCSGTFFEDYALQATVTLDTSVCQGIEAPGATEANVGGDKQLTYTILPGAGADITITAQVSDFEMDGIAINGVPLSLDIEVDDDELMDRITELTDAIAELDDGAGELSGGVAELQSGAQALADGGSELRSGAASLQSGAAELQSGAQDLQSGIDALGAGLAELNSQSSQLVEASGQIMAVLRQFQAAIDGVDLTEEDLAVLAARLADAQTAVDGLIAGLESLSDTVNALTYVRAVYGEVDAELTAAIIALEDETDTTALLAAQAKLQANNANFDAALAGMESLSGTAEGLETGLAAVSEALAALSGDVGGLPTLVGEIQTGVDGLVESYGTLDSGIQAYADGVAQLYSGYGVLSDGASQLVGGTSALRSGASALTGGADEMDSGAAALAEGIAQLGDGAGQMQDGTAAMRDETAGMDEQIQQRIDDMLQSVTGGEGEIVSFVSAENTDVRAVQFVITAPAIEKQTPMEQEPEAEPETTFWQKLIALF